MNKQEKLELIGSAFVTLKRADGTEFELYTYGLNDEVRDKLSEIQQVLDVGLDASYEIMSEACDIVGNLEIEVIEGGNLDLYSDCDAAASVYTAVQLSYLNVNNENEISDLMKELSFTSIALACSYWHTQKVQEAAEALVAYILE